MIVILTSFLPGFDGTETFPVTGFAEPLVVLTVCALRAEETQERSG